MKTDKCKIMRSKYNYTPNDYDITFDISKVPSNIKIENVVNLSQRLQNHMPVAKTIHLNLRDYAPSEIRNSINVHTSIVLDCENGVFDLREYSEAPIIVPTPVLNIYVSGEQYNENINVGELFIVTVIDDTFQEPGTDYTEVYKNIQLTLYDEQDNTLQIPYETNIYKDSAVFTIPYGESTILDEGKYKIKVESPATIHYQKSQAELQIQIQNGD